jgi:L-lactate dehydrogenase complex protein LldG
MFSVALGALTGKTHEVGSPAAARDKVKELVAGKTAVATASPLLKAWGITELAGVQSGFADARALREAAAMADFGITVAEYGLAETGTLVMRASAEESRLVSLLPPIHIAILQRERLLSGLDEFYTRFPLPGDHTSATVFITGPSRTADIEMLLVRGVHGPGAIHVIVV